MKKLKIAALASAFALVGSVWAAAPVDWFDGKITTGWPNVEGMNGSWSDNATELATFQEAVADPESPAQLELDAGDSTLSFTATAAKDLSANTKSVTYTTKVKFYPYSEVPDTVDSEAKAGAIAVYDEVREANCLYVLAENSTEDGNEWVMPTDVEELPITISTTTTYTLQVTIVSNAVNQLSVTYSITGGEYDNFTVNYSVYSESASTSQACYSGSGYIETLTSQSVAATKTFTISSAALETAHLKVESVSGATEDPEGTYTVDYGQQVVITFSATGTYAIKDGNTATYEYADITSGAAIAEFGDVETEEGKACIGSVYYITLNKAIEAAVLMDSTAASPVTVELKTAEHPADAGFVLPVNSSGTDKALVIDLGGYTYTFGSGYTENSGLPIYLNVGWQLTLKNGTLNASAAYAGDAEHPISEFIRDYTSKVTLDGVTLDASNFTVEKSVAIKQLNGDVDVVNGAAITAPDGVEFHAFEAGDYTLAKAYTEGTITLNTTGTVEGDWVLYGSKIVKTAANIPAETKFYHATVAKTRFSPANVKLSEGGDSGFGFKAISGAIQPIPDPTPSSKYLVIGGRILTSFADAFNDTGYEPADTATAIIDLDADVEVPESKTLVMGEFSLNSHQIKLNTGSVVTSNAQLAPSDFKDLPAGKTAVETAITGGYSYTLGDATYTITVNANGGEGGSADPANYQMSAEDFEVTLTQPTAPAGKEFASWSVSGITAEVVNDKFTVPANSAANITVTANWQDIAYAITIVDPGTAEATPDTYVYDGELDQEVSLTESPAKDGYTFDGYTLTAKSGVSLDGTTITISAGTTGDITVTANWTAVSYKITVDANGGEGGSADPATYTISDADTPVALTQPTAPSGKTFDGWSATAGTISGDTLTIPAGVFEDITVTASWKDASVTPVVPGESGHSTAATEEQAKQDVIIALPTGASEAGITQIYYDTLFDKTVTGTSGDYTVTITLKQTVIDAQNATEGPAVTTTKAIDVSGIAAGTVGADTVDATGLTPGLYYSIQASTDLSFPSSDATSEGARVLVGSDGTATLTVPEKSGTAVFFRTLVNTGDNKVGE